MHVHVWHIYAIVPPIRFEAVRSIDILAIFYVFLERERSVLGRTYVYLLAIYSLCTYRIRLSI